MEAAEARAEDLRQRVKTLAVKSKDKELGPVSVSLGVAVFPVHANTRDALIAAADGCLYRAKAGGRDRVVVADRTAEAPPAGSGTPPSRR